MRRALIVFAKRPVAGRVKTRLTPAIDEAEAADLYRSFLLDALDQYAGLEVDVRLYVSPSTHDHAYVSPSTHDHVYVLPSTHDHVADERSTSKTFGGLDGVSVVDEVSVFDRVSVLNEVSVLAQRGEGLGDRMAGAFEETFSAGYDRVAIVGTDHPTLPTAFIDYAFKSISSPRSIAIGPADDGGYYLLAMRNHILGIFSDMAYSHANVFSETLRRACAAASEIIVLPAWYDVDTPAELRRLRADLGENAAAAPRTAAVLRHLEARYEWLAG